MDQFEYLRDMGCRKARGMATLLFLDGFSSDFYLVFDTEEDPETPASKGTVNVFVCKPGSSPLDSCDRILLRDNCKRHDVMRILAAIGVNQFSDKVKSVYYALSNPLRKEPQA